MVLQAGRPPQISGGRYPTSASADCSYRRQTLGDVTSLGDPRDSGNAVVTDG